MAIDFDKEFEDIVANQSKDIDHDDHTEKSDNGDSKKNKGWTFRFKKTSFSGNKTNTGDINVTINVTRNTTPFESIGAFITSILPFLSGR